MHSIATKTGDSGETSLLFGRRVTKTHSRIRVNGSLDEWSCALGIARAHLPAAHDFRIWIRTIQECLIGLMGEIAVEEGDRERYLASKLQRIQQVDLDTVEQWLGKLEQHGLVFTGWAIPGDHLCSVYIEQARAVGRCAERELIALIECGHLIPEITLPWMNRCADLLWMMARVLEYEQSCGS
jgi:cob(I)alamin adenosyltransferase